MRFLTHDEARHWASHRAYEVTSPATANPGALPEIRVRIPSDLGSIVGFCRRISGYLSPRAGCLLWVVNCGIWPSSENWHLYYRLRQSYGDSKLIDEAPGHLFLDYEEADLVTYLQLAVLNGWDANVLPQLTYGIPATAHAFVSHDEWVLLAHRNEATLAQWRSELSESGHQFLDSA